VGAGSERPIEIDVSDLHLAEGSTITIRVPR
jgi:hypothetical protein